MLPAGINWLAQELSLWGLSMNEPLNCIVSPCWLQNWPSSLSRVSGGWGV